MIEAIVSTALFVGLVMIIGEPLWKKQSLMSPQPAQRSAVSAGGRFCRHCGASVTLNDRFCHACGQQLA